MTYPEPFKKFRVRRNLKTKCVHEARILRDEILEDKEHQKWKGYSASLAHKLL
jgi:hypothetical protein